MNVCQAVHRRLCFLCGTFTVRVVSPHRRFRTLIIPEKALVLSSDSNARVSTDRGRFHYEYACFP